MSTGRKLVSDVPKGKYYLYRYIRTDKNLVFYVGIGTKAFRKTEFRLHKAEYHRAHYNHHSKILKKVIDKTCFDIEIILESDSYDFIKQKEIEFIKLYGRIDLNTGSLTNLTDGGEGTVGFKMSEETKKKLSLNNASKGKFGKDHPNAKKAYQYDIKGNFIKEWDSLADIGRAFNSSIPTFTNKKSKKTYKGFQWFYKYKGEKIAAIDYEVGIKSRIYKTTFDVYQYSLDNVLISIHKSITAAKIATGVSITGIHSALNRVNKVCRGYIWSKEILINTKTI